MNVWIRILRAVGPPLLAALFPASRLTPIILAGVEAAEESGATRGAEKKAIAMTHVAEGVAATNAAARDAIDPSTALTHASDAIDAIVATVNTWAKIAEPAAAAAAEPLLIVPQNFAPPGKRS